MAVKNIIAKIWTLAPSFDGLKYSAWPAGDKPAGFLTAPTLLNTDIISGSLTNGENGKGAYLRLFGYNFGTVAAFGTSAGAQVFLRDPLGDNLWHGVDNYRYLRKSRTYTINQVQTMCVQVGNAGSWTAGRTLDLKVTVNGVDTNILTGQFTVQQGHFYFVSLTGSEGTGTVDDITKPYRYVWQWDGTSSFTGIALAIKAGDTIVVRGGNWSDQTFANRWVNFWTQTGSNPTGAANHGYIHITSYPGELVHHTGAVGGGIQGCDSTRAANGGGQYVSISDFHIETGAAAAQDAGPVNLQNGANFWRVFDCECGPWPSTLVSPANARSSAIGGQGINVIIAFNDCHDIDCDANNPGSSALENHGMYMGGASGGAFDAASQNVEICYNWVHNIPGGSGIQFYWQGSSGGAYTTSVFTGIKIHHNFVDTVKKYGINMSKSTVSGDIYLNIITNTGLNGMRFEGLSYSAGVNLFNLNFEQNTVYSWNYRSSISDAGFLSEGYANTGTIKINHNMFVGGFGRAGTISWYSNGVFAGADSNVTMSQNLYYDYAATPFTGSAAKDSTPITASPLFTSKETGDFTCQAGGAGINALTTTEAVVCTVDFYGIPKSTNKDLGACEGIGT